MDTAPDQTVQNEAHSKRRALGRGIESLLPPRPAAIAPTPPGTSEVGKPREIALDLIERNPFQTRSQFDEEKLKELADSIAATGVVQPILVRPIAEGRFQLIAGERRWLASRIAGKETVPAMVRQVSDEQAMEITIVENLQRADLNPMEQARAYGRLGRDFKMTQEEMSTRTGKDRASIGNFLRLLKLPVEVQGHIESSALSFGHARALLALGSPEQIAKVAHKVIETSLSVRQTETYIQGLLFPKTRDPGPQAKVQSDPNVRAAQEKLQQALGLKVRIEHRKGRGRVVIHYSGLEDFDSLMAAIVTEN